MNCSQCFQQGIILDDSSFRVDQQNTIVYIHKNLYEQLTKNGKKRMMPEKISLKRQKIKPNQVPLCSLNTPILRNNKINKQIPFYTLQTKQYVKYIWPIETKITHNRAPLSSREFQPFHNFVDSKNRLLQSQYNSFNLKKEINYIKQSQKTACTSITNSLSIYPKLNLYHNLIKQEGTHQIQQKNFPLIKLVIKNIQQNQNAKSENELQLQFQNDLKQIIQQIYNTKIQIDDTKNQQPNQVIGSQLTQSSKQPKYKQFLVPNQNKGKSLINSRISHTLSSVRNIQEIMCTKTESVGNNSSQSHCSEIIQTYMTKMKTTKNSTISIPNDNHSESAMSQNTIRRRKIETKKSLYDV